MEPKTKQNLLVTVIGVTLFAALMNLSTVLTYAEKLVDLILPIIAGSILALFINIPMKGIENSLRKRLKKAMDKQILILSFILTILSVLLVIVLVLTLLIPEVVTSSRNLIAQVQEQLPYWRAYLETLEWNAQWLEDTLASLDIDKITGYLSEGLDALLPNVVGVLSSSVSMVVTAGFAMIISIYLTLSKQEVGRHAEKLVCAYLKPKWAENLLRFCRMFHASFAKFLSGQCTEAIILGVLMFLAFTIFRLPYGSLVGVLTAVCAIIPYVGAFISCAVSILLTLLLDPALVIRCVIVYLATQFIENQFIYPKVVGESVGLSPLYTLIAAMIGGKIFGILGIIFFIPLTAVVIEIVKVNANHRLQRVEAGKEAIHE